MREHLRSALAGWIGSLESIIRLLDALSETDWSSVDRITSIAVDVFGDAPKAALWMISYQPSLRGAPLATLLAGDEQEVLRLLQKANHRLSAPWDPSSCPRIAEFLDHPSSPTLLNYCWVPVTESSASVPDDDLEDP